MTSVVWPQTGADGLPFWVKDPGASKDYSQDYTAWLAGDTIATSAWEVPSGITQTDATRTTSGTTIWLSGGEHGRIYRIKNTITTAGGRTEVRSFNIVVRET